MVWKAFSSGHYCYPAGSSEVLVHDVLDRLVFDIFQAIECTQSCASFRHLKLSVENCCQFLKSGLGNMICTPDWLSSKIS